MEAIFFIFFTHFATESFFPCDVEGAGGQAVEEEEDVFEVKVVDPCPSNNKPVPVKHGFLPVFYENKGKGSFQCNKNDIVSEESIDKNLYGQPINTCYGEQFVVIMRPKAWLQEMGIEMKEGPGWKWDALEMCYTEDSKPDGENYGWNGQLQEFGKLCEHDSGCFKPDWDKWVTYPERDHDASKLLFSNNHGMYSTHECVCDGCGNIFNPTDKDEVRQHSFKKGSSVRRCDDMLDFGP